MTVNLDSCLENPSELLKFSKNDLFSLDPESVERYQLKVIAGRFDMLKEKIEFLRELAEAQSVRDVRDWDDVASLLFDPDHAYKSYPLEWIEEGRFDLLTKWINRFTTVDLSGIDAGDCKRILDWCRLLEEKAKVLVRHSSGTSGTLSFFLRTLEEDELIPAIWMWLLQGFRDEPDFSLKKGKDNHVTMFSPHARNMYRAQTTIFNYFEKWYSGNPVRTVVDDYFPDIARYFGYRRTFLEKGGNIEELLSKPIYRELEEEMKAFEQNFSKSYEAWMEDVLSNYKGKRIFMFAFTRMVHDLAKSFKSQGLRGVFKENSIFIMSAGGGGEQMQKLPDGWEEEAFEVLGLTENSFKLIYGFSENIEVFPRCPGGNHHFSPMTAIGLVNEKTGKFLPREGIQSGRIALFDLLPETYWGGNLAGDLGTINFDEGCSCGRKGPYLYGDRIKRL